MANGFCCCRASHVAVAVFLALAAVAGCQSNSTALTRVPPAPSFDGPRIIKAAPAPVVASQKPAPAAPAGPREWSPRVPARPWKWIVVHHSASPTGSMAAFDKEHKARGWDGVGYHFVIGNGTRSADGQVEVTARWPVQKWGAHAKTVDNRYNEQGIGICLVGNFDLERPTSAQMDSLTTLIAHLMRTYRIPPQNVIGHRDTKATECPGRWMNVAQLRQMATRAVADAGASANDSTAADSEPAVAAPDHAQTAGIELLGDAR